jgi:hypothetical protein
MDTQPLTLRSSCSRRTKCCARYLNNLKGQFDTATLTNRVGGRMPQVWEAVLSA